MRKHYLRIWGTPNFDGCLPKIKICTPDLKFEKTISISIQSVQVYFRQIRHYESQWELCSNLVSETVWDHGQLVNKETPLANFLTRKQNDYHHYEWNGNIWFDITRRDQHLRIRITDPILGGAPIQDDVTVYIVIGISTCD